MIQLNSNVVQPPAAHHGLHPDAGVEEPFPGDTGDDEAERHRIEIDRADKTFRADALIEQDCQQQSEGTADGDVKETENDQIGNGRVPRPDTEQVLVVLPADPSEGRQDPAVGKGQIEREQDEAVNEDRDDGDSRAQHDFG